MIGWIKSKVIREVRDIESERQAEIMGTEYEGEEILCDVLIKTSEVCEVCENRLEYQGEILPATTVVYKSGYSISFLTPYAEVVKTIF